VRKWENSEPQPGERVVLWHTLKPWEEKKKNKAEPVFSITSNPSSFACPRPILGIRPASLAI
jgi:hypothetical protein